MSDTPLTDTCRTPKHGYVPKEFAENLERENAKLRGSLERRNRDASTLRKLHEGRLAPSINIELIQAEDAAEMVLEQTKH